MTIKDQIKILDGKIRQNQAKGNKMNLIIY